MGFFSSLLTPHSSLASERFRRTGKVLMGKPIAIVCRRRFPPLICVVALLCAALAAGCAAMTNPTLIGIPVRLLPPELRGKSVAGMQTIPLSLLGQQRPENYRIDGGDVLGVWIETILGELGQQPPIQSTVNLGNIDLPPSIGYPIQVDRDGTISLPRIEPLRVAGMTFKEAENAIRKAYLNAQIIKEHIRILVTLMRPRTYHVLVLREDSPTPQGGVVTSQLGGSGPEYISASRKGTGWDLVMPAYHNDVLTALAKTGGLPGTDAYDELIIERNTPQGGRNWEMIAQEFQANGPPACVPGGPIMRIPLRVRRGTPLPIRPEDVVLRDGDVVYVPAREERLFFTGGLLPPGQHILPRDTDLDVIEAIARVRGPLMNGNFSTSNLAGTMILPGLGQPSPTLLSVVRRMPDGCGQITIRVDLNLALKDTRERLLVQAGDFLILQETPEQGIVRYLTQVVELPFYYVFSRGPNLITAGAFNYPGGVAPTPTIVPMGFGTSVNTGYSVGSATSGAGTSPIPISTIPATPTTPVGR
jgi:protein involved in polysaccharide export with SLBB domain